MTYEPEQFLYGYEGDRDGLNVNNVVTGLPMKTHQPNQAPAQDPEVDATNKFDVLGNQYQMYDLKPKEPGHNGKLCLVRPQILWGKTGIEDLTFQALIKYFSVLTFERVVGRFDPADSYNQWTGRNFVMTEGRGFGKKNV